MPESIYTLRAQYFALYPAYLLDIPSPSMLSDRYGQSMLFQLLLNEEFEDDDSECEEEEVDPMEKDKDQGYEWDKMHRVLREVQPEEGYRKQVWRRMIDVLEKGVAERVRMGDREAEVDGRFYTVVADLMVSSNPSSHAGSSSAPKTSYRTFIYESPVSFTASLRRPPKDTRRVTRWITLLEEQIAIQGGTTGLRTWTAALHLGHHILHNPRRVFPRRPTRGVIELGAGTGFLSVLLAQLGVNVLSTDLGHESETEEVALVDVDPQEVDGEGFRTPLGRLRRNIALNECAETPSVRALDWTDARKPPAERPPIWAHLEEAKRTIVAADVIYDPDLVHPLVDAIEVLLGEEEGMNAVISATIRNTETFNLFLDICEEQGLDTENIQVPPMDPAKPSFWDSALDAGTEVRLLRVTKPHTHPRRKRKT